MTGNAHLKRDVMRILASASQVCLKIHMAAFVILPSIFVRKQE